MTNEKKIVGTGVEQRITIRGGTLGDTKTVIISPNGTQVRVIEGEF